MTSERVSQEESNKVNFSSMAPSGKELCMNAPKFDENHGRHGVSLCIAISIL